MYEWCVNGEQVNQPSRIVRILLNANKIVNHTINAEVFVRSQGSHYMWRGD